MILNHNQIIARIKRREVIITPYSESNIGTNSYDVHLGNELMIYKEMQRHLDPMISNPTRSIEIPESGYVLDGRFYLACTKESCENHAKDLVPMIEGRSGIARLGLQVHVTAGFGDIGYCGNWTLELVPHKTIIVYPGMPIAQLYWLSTEEAIHTYKGNYQNENKTTASRLWRKYD